ALGPRGPLPPEDVAARLNTLTLEEMRTDLYFTLFYGDLDLATGRLDFVQAGHPPPLHVHGRTARFLGRGGMPVGLIDDAFYSRESLVMRPGHRLLVYSDGITECEGPDGMLGEGGLRRLALAGADDLIGALGRGLRRHAAGAPPQDDVSALLLEWRG
ncbi:MAG: PP2C family protein-serine/threonine phosphatase, partial [Hasllibacter sp.]